MNYINKLATNKIASSIFVNLLSGRLFFGKLVILVNVFSILISWYFNKSVAWLIFHYFFGFWYLIYSVLMQRFHDGGFMEILNYYF